MRTDDWRRIDRLFDRALDLEGTDRARFLKEIDDEPLRAHVERLLNLAEARQDEPLPGGADRDALMAALSGEDEGRDLTLGTEIDRFRVVREIGRGGMAVVYLAERADGEFQQKVALKLIKRGIDTDEVLERFSRERQILARISHPHIARLLDGGTTEDGRPYFVMEHVEGQRIDNFVDERNLGVSERLDLFLQLADAVGHAHRNLVVHGDIKPSNVLVDAEGRARLLDFGIAQYVRGSDQGRVPTQTAEGGRFLTPTWASPEQIRGRTVTTASDVYQLGALLYRLLAGRPPHDVPHDDAGALQRAICETSPPAASRVVTDPSLQRELAGDLDTICATALRIEPERRYDSVGHLVDDIRRYLRGMPIAARPDSAAYRLSKLVRRHRVSAAFAAVAMVLLVAFALTMSIQAGRIARERDRANLEARTASEVVDFLTGLFRVSEPGEALGNTIAARTLLDQGAAQIDEELSDQPEMQARLMRTMGGVYQQLGLYEEARRLLEQAAALFRRELGRQHLDTLITDSRRAALYFEMALYDEAEGLGREVRDLQRAGLGAEHPETLFTSNLLANLHNRRGEYDEAERLYAEVLDSRRQVLGPDAPETLSSLFNLAALHWSRGRTEDAEPLFVETFEARRRLFGEDHPDTLNSLNNLANLYQRQERYDRAESLYRDALERRRRVLGPDHPQTLTSSYNLAALHQKLGHYDESERLYLETLEARRRVLGPDHLKTLRTVNGLADLYSTTGRQPAAEALFREALEAQRALLGPRHPETAVTEHNLACVLRDLGRHTEADRMFDSSREALIETLGDDHPFVAMSHEEQAKLHALMDGS